MKGPQRWRRESGAEDILQYRELSEKMERVASRDLFVCVYIRRYIQIGRDFVRDKS